MLDACMRLCVCVCARARSRACVALTNGSKGELSFAGAGACHIAILHTVDAEGIVSVLMGYQDNVIADALVMSCEILILLRACRTWQKQESK